MLWLVICPFCGQNDDKVIDSRASDGGKVIRRRRECLNAKCGRRFTTYERVEEMSRLTIIKKDGTRQPFDRDKVLRGIVAACGKRPIGDDAKRGIVDWVEEELHRQFEREAPSSRVGELVCQKLREVDEVAYIRYASEYHQFHDAGEVARAAAEVASSPKDVKDQARLF